MNEVKTNVPVIPREVAEAIEYFRDQGVGNERIVKLAMDIGFGPQRRALHLFVRTFGGFDTLLAALINGYTVEKSAAEAAHDKIRANYREHDDAAEFARVGAGNEYAAGRCRGYRYGVEETLEALGIKIEGVNA